MSAITSASPNIRSSLLRPIVLGGVIIGVLHSIIQHWLVFNLLDKTPLILVYQYFASGALGNPAFEGGLAIALLGLLFHFLVSFILAGVFILSADRIPLLRRRVFAGALLYGFGAFIVMNFIVLPLSAAPPLPAPTPSRLIEVIIEHILVIGLPLALLVRRDANIDK